MKKGAPKQHLIKRPCPGGVQTLFMNTVSQFVTVFWGARGSQKAAKMRSKSIQNGGVGSQKAIRGPLQKSEEIWIDFRTLLGLQMDPGGGTTSISGVFGLPKNSPKRETVFKKWFWTKIMHRARTLYLNTVPRFERLCSLFLMLYGHKISMISMILSIFKNFVANLDFFMILMLISSICWWFLKHFGSILDHLK